MGEEMVSISQDIKEEKLIAALRHKINIMKEELGINLKEVRNDISNVKNVR